MIGFGRSVYPLWGGKAVVVTAEPQAINAARDLVRAETAAMDAACSRFRPDSELTRVNELAGEPVHVGPLFAEVVSAALRAAAATAGDVDPTCGAGLEAVGYDRDIEVLREEGVRIVVHEYLPAPGWQSVGWNPGTRTLRAPPGCRLDFGAVAKALAADRAAAAVADGIGCGVLVSLGGDIATAGPAPDKGWRIRVTDDHRSGESAPGQTISVHSGALATSSTTARRWQGQSGPLHHVLDPRTGRPADSCWRTVSVTAANCVDANTAATAALVRGKAAEAWLAGLGLPARLVRHDGTVQTVGGWPDEAAETLEG
ncbi:FAD:protein FMN transferase [Actinospica sp.]|uniref:FAD:protein FMN transferase n=1 Tax=Actinospica sp. TaxID=1872142 RepID=UPI002CA1A3A5|nr:FAD:protein FMN transferase [Actinospica sp.]HWG28870.1 FAD:protein FMN transferase [Actinospica sp.]